MRKRIALIGVVVIVMMLALSAVVWAQGPTERTGESAPMGRGFRFQDANTDGVCESFVDEDGDGVCDQMGTRGNRYQDEDADGVCDNFVDEDGGGVCDMMGAGQAEGRGRAGSAQFGRGQGRRGMMHSQGMAACGGTGFLDEDGDGVCDSFVAADGDGVCDQMSAQPGAGRGRMGGRMGGR